MFDFLFHLSKADAQILLTGLGILISLIVSKIKDVTWPDYVKFGIVALFSVIAGTLTAYLADQINPENSIIQNVAIVLTASQAFYYGVLKALGLEKRLFPQQALLTVAQSQLSEKIKNVPIKTAKEVISSQAPAEIDVKVEISGQSAPDKILS